jgi:predicted transcriptional regulator
MMESCFVMQPFDGGRFDKRYKDVFDPAIRKAGLEPYRVDADPSVVIPIDEIADRIRKSEYCFAEISTDNPNVWFELGFAIACGKHVVLACSDERQTQFPFDVRHRTIITYKTESSQDFEHLGGRIADALNAAQKKQNESAALASMSPIAEMAGLSEHEIVCLATVAQNQNGPDDAVTMYSIKEDMRRSGSTDLAASMAVNSLSRKGLLEYRQNTDDRGDVYFGYRATDAGFEWLDQNQHKLVLHRKKVEPKRGSYTGDDADIPF